MTWGCSPITALLTSMRSAPPIMDKKDKRANAKRNRRRGPKLGPDAARRSLRPPMDKEDERASLRRDTDDVVIRFAGILKKAGAQLKPASFWAVSLTDRVYVAAGGRRR